MEYTIRDGLKSFKVEVDITKDDIRQGRMRNCNDCPTALALFRAVPESTYVSVGTHSASLDIDGISFKSSVNAEMWDFVTTFDSEYRHYDAKPVKFTLNFVERV